MSLYKYIIRFGRIINVSKFRSSTVWMRFIVQFEPIMEDFRRVQIKTFMNKFGYMKSKNIKVVLDYRT